jgi:hypothetical protein
MEKYCKAITDILWDTDAADRLIAKAATAVEVVAGGDLRSDNVRTQPFTDRLIKHCLDTP